MPNDATPAARPPKSGLRSLFKTAVPLALLFGVVFGVIFITQYTPKVDEKELERREGGGNEPPLRFFTSVRQWDPQAESLPDRVFPGFFERDTRGAAEFWFENRNARPVLLQLKGVSCTSCSDGWLAPIPPATTRSILEMAAVGGLPLGPFNGLHLGMAGAGAGVSPDRIPYQAHEFRTTDWLFKVPAADNPTGWTPQWGILALNFKAGQRQELSAMFATQVEGTTQYREEEFKIAYVTVPPLEITKAEIKVGDLDDNSADQRHELVVFSTTRGAGARDPLPTPTVRVLDPAGRADPGTFITVGTPAALAPEELDRLAEDLARTGTRLRVRAAYRITVTVRPKVGDQRLDIGALDRDLWVSAGDPQQMRQVKLTGTVRGGVSLSEGKEIDLKSFQSKVGSPERSFEVVTDNPATDLAVARTEVEERLPGGEVRKTAVDHVVVNGRVAPDVLKVAVVRQDRKEPDRGYFTLKVRVPPDAHQGQFLNSYVVLDVKGPAPRRLQIPVKGSATR
jgi:hypothetical protein